MREGIRFISHIANMGAASGTKRIAYAFGNIVITVLGILCMLGIKMLWSGVSDSKYNFFAALLGIIILAALMIVMILQGFAAQVALVFMSLIGIFIPGEKLGNAVSFVISLASVISAVVYVLHMLGAF